jgi:hypothetical protein
MNSSFKTESSVVKAHPEKGEVEKNFARATKQVQFNFALYIVLVFGHLFFDLSFFGGVVRNHFIAAFCGAGLYQLIVSVIRLRIPNYQTTPAWWKITRENFYSGIFLEINYVGRILGLKPEDIYTLRTKEIRALAEKHLFQSAFEIVQQERALQNLKKPETRTAILKALEILGAQFDSTLKYFLHVGFTIPWQGNPVDEVRRLRKYFFGLALAALEMDEFVKREKGGTD